MEDFTATQLKVIEWLALPKGKRVPKNQIELGAVLGVSDELISRWKSNPDFKAAVWAKIQELAGDDDATIIAHIKLNAKLRGREGVQDRRLWMQWRGQLIDKQENVTPEREVTIKVIRVSSATRTDNTRLTSGSVEDQE